MEALGEPITDVIAHRPERICALLDLTPATPLSPRHIAALLAHPSGGRKGVPASACYIPFLNKVQDDVLLRGARAVMAHVRGLPGIERVLIGAALSLQPVLEVWQ
jgi:molybdenum cofactor cytidylyltransferase